ncbi:MAG: hypothetical protein GVY13_12580 [Alphaproteobacteria bacterium]|jgi:uncharacterized YccA/Bax inhibitor family protein|nr:hypothetical protein [Alphaproteobacteria bacterium]
MTPVPLGSPLLSAAALRRQDREDLRDGTGLATTRSTLRKIGVLLALMVGAAAVVVVLFYPAVMAGNEQAGQDLRNFAFGSGVLAFATAFMATYRKRWSPVIAPLYALTSGTFLSGLAISAELRFPGFALQSLVLTGAVFLAMFIGYRTGLIEPTRRFRAIVYAATAGIALVYLFSFLLLLAGYRLPIIHDAGWGGILWAGFVVSIAALNLVISFETVATLGRRGYAKFMEWYVALGFLVTFVWLYFSVIRLLQRVRG